MASKSSYRYRSVLFKALAHPLRMEVIDILQKGELCFSNIHEKTGGLKSSLSQHLSILVAAGILLMRKDSRCNYYRLSSANVSQACHLMGGLLLKTKGPAFKTSTPLRRNG